MTKQAPITKILPVPDHPSKKEFLSGAGKVWKEHHPEAERSLGRPSRAFLVFEACENKAYKVIEIRRKKRERFHNEHTPEDPDDAFRSLSDCQLCDDELLPYSAYAIRQEVRKQLNDLHPEQLKGKDFVGERTLDRHVAAWLLLKLHPEWLATGIPKQFHKKNFNLDQVKAYDRQRQAYLARFEKINTSNLSKPKKNKMTLDLAQEPFYDAMIIREYFGDGLARSKKSKQASR